MWTSASTTLWLLTRTQMAMAGAHYFGAAGVVVSADGGFLPVCLISFFSVVVVVPPGVLTSFFSVTVADSPQPTSPNVSVKRPVPARAVMSFFMVFLCPAGFQRPATSPEAHARSPLVMSIHARFMPAVRQLCEDLMRHAQ